MFIYYLRLQRKRSKLLPKASLPFTYLLNPTLSIRVGGNLRLLNNNTYIYKHNLFNFLIYLIQTLLPSKVKLLAAARTRLPVSGKRVCPLTPTISMARVRKQTFFALLKLPLARTARVIPLNYHEHSPTSIRRAIQIIHCFAIIFFI